MCTAKLFLQPQHLRCRLAALFLFAGHVLPAHAAAALGFDEALALAETRSLQVVAQGAAAAGAREMAVAAGQRPDPSLRFSLDALPINGPDRFSLVRDDFTMRTIGVTQELTRAAKRKARAARYEREAETAEAGRVAALANVRRDTAIAWLDRHHQDLIRTALLAQREEGRLQVEAAEAAYRGGRGAQAEVFAARSAVALIEDRIDQSERQIATAMTQLARWLGEDARRPLAAAGAPATGSLPFGAEDLEARFAHHPEVALLQRRESVAQAEADLARADKQADWSVGLTYARRGPSYSDYVFLSVSVPLQWDQKNRQDRELAARLAAVEQARAERGDATRGHVAETLAMLQEWQSNRRRLARYDDAMLPLAAERSRAAQSAYRGGSAALMPLLEARRAEIDTRVERLKLAQETARLWAQLNYLLPAANRAATGSSQ